MEILYNKEKSYTVTPTNVVGATTNSILRTVTVHNDTNCKYVAMNGDDTTGTGTSGNPYRTIEKAVSTLGGAFMIVTIIRNSYIGDLSFEAPDTSLSGGHILQVELGELATILRSSFKTIVDATGSTLPATDFAYYNNRWVATITGSNKMYYSFNGIIWTITASVTANWTGIAVDTNGKWVAVADQLGIYTSTDGINWTVASSPPPSPGTKLWSSIAVNDQGLFVVTSFGNTSVNPTPLYYSTDGDTWAVCNNSNQLWYYVTWKAGKWVATSSQFLYYSTDGINWLLTNAGEGSFIGVDGNSEGNYWIAVKNNKFIYSYDIIEWFSLDTPNEIFGFITNFGTLWIAGGNSTKLYYSLDGKTFLEMTNSTSNNYTRIRFNKFGFCQAGSQSTNQIQYITTWLLYLPNNLSVINGFILDGQNLIPNGINYNYTSSPVLEWNTFQNLRYNTCNDNVGSFQENIFNGGLYGLYETSSVLWNNLFYNQTEISILYTGTTPSIQWNTIVNSNTGIKLTKTITSVDNFKNNLVAYCSQALESVVTNITPTYSLFHGDLINVILDTTSLDQVKPLFHDFLTNDFHIRHLAEGYPFDSPGVEQGEFNTDVGCYTLNISSGSATYTSILLHEKDYKVTRKPFVVNAFESYTLNAAYHRTIEDELSGYLVESKSGNNKEFQQIKDLMRQDKPFICKPQNNGITSTNIQGSFKWLDKTKINGLIECIANIYTDVDLEATKWIGNYMAVGAIAGSSTPWSNGYFFKIICHERTPDGKHKFILENYLDNWPGTGFAADPDGTYNAQLWETMLMFWAEYMGLDNGYEKFEAQTTNAYYGERNQWKGYCSLLQNMRIVRHKDKDFWMEQFIDPTWSPSIGTQYMFIMEVLNVKIVPASLEPSPTADNWLHGKKGNDYHSTPATRENHPDFDKTGFLVDNEKNFSFTLKESIETDVEDL